MTCFLVPANVSPIDRSIRPQYSLTVAKFVQIHLLCIYERRATSIIAMEGG